MILNIFSTFALIFKFLAQSQQQFRVDDQGDHEFSKYATFSKKLTFFTP